LILIAADHYHQEQSRMAAAARRIARPLLRRPGSDGIEETSEPALTG